MTGAFNGSDVTEEMVTLLPGVSYSSLVELIVSAIYLTAMTVSVHT